ncbi:MAG: hypothetical protein KIT09_17855 [Bryobacteraceae bacterium]|nr:hypothetical protein [Bryobacteraceae bacterium]
MKKPLLLLIACISLIGAAGPGSRSGVMPGASSDPDIHSLWTNASLLVFRDLGGLAMGDGDIILGRTAELTAPARGREARAVLNQIRRWPGAVMPYEIEAGMSGLDAIDDAIRYWNDRAPLKLVARQTEENWVWIRRFDDPGALGASWIGMAGGRQELFLSTRLADPNAPRGLMMQTILHELGHAAGLLHEQHRHDRDAYIRVRTVDFCNYCLEQPGHLGPYGPLGDLTNAGLGPYDYASIMHYDPTQQSGFRMHFETIPPGIPVNHSALLSAGDIDAISRLYGAAPSRTTITTNPEGLQVIVDGAAYTSPHVFDWAPGETHSVHVEEQVRPGARYSFGRWSDGGARTHTVAAGPDVTVYTANFVAHHLLSLKSEPADSGEVRLYPQAADRFYRLRSFVELSAVPRDGYFLERWAPAILSDYIWASPGGLSRTVGLSSEPLLTPMFEGLEYTARFTDRAPIRILSNIVGAAVEVESSDVAGTAFLPANFANTPGRSYSFRIPLEQRAPTAWYVFTGWEDGSTGERAIDATGEPLTLTASFRREHTLGWIVSPAPGGRVFASPSSDATPWRFPSGSSVEVTAVPNPGWEFGYWLGDLSGDRNPETVRMTATLNVHAVFQPSGSAPPSAAASTPHPAAVVFHADGSINSAERPAAPGAAITLHVPTSHRARATIAVRIGGIPSPARVTGADSDWEAGLVTVETFIPGAQNQLQPVDVEVNFGLEGWRQAGAVWVR